jgi:hypothetical protein
MRPTSRITAILAISLLCVLSNAGAQNGTVATVESIRGEVLSGGAPIFQGQRISPGSRLTTGRGAQLVLRFDDGMRVALPETTIFVPADVRSGQVMFDLLGGAARIRTGDTVRANPGRFSLRTSHAQFGVAGPADFTVAVSDAAYLSVREGTVVASNAGGSTRFGAGGNAQVRNPGSQPAAIPALPAGTASTASALNALDLERRQERIAAEAAEAAELERQVGPPPRAQKFWAGGALALSRYDDAATAGLLSQGTLDGQSNGFRIFAGYQFSKHVGLEVGYADLGEVDYRGSFQGVPVTDGKLGITGFDVALVVSFVVAEKTMLFGKVGAFAWEAEANDVAGGVPFSTSTDGTNAMLGIGLAYAVSPTAALRAEIESRRAADEVVNTFSFGVEFRF